MIKIFNTKGIIIVVAILAALHLATALLVSPVAASAVISALNNAANTKISAEKVNVWPLTLTITAAGVRIFDPDDETKRILLLERSSARLSVIGLLSKRVVFSDITVSGAHIDLEGEPDGTFNLQKLAPPSDVEAEKPSRGSIMDIFKGKQDWFSRVYEMVKRSTSKKASEERKQRREEALKIEKDVHVLPKGREVTFTRPGEDSLVYVKNFVIKDSHINMVSQGITDTAITGAYLRVKDISLDARSGLRFRHLELKGDLEDSGAASGSFRLFYDQRMKGENLISEFDIYAKEVDLRSTRSFYKESLPIDFTSGFISATSKTRIVNGDLESRNSFLIKDHNMVPKRGSSSGSLKLPLPLVCDAVNKMDPFKLEFGISGTIGSPRLEGFEKALIAAIEASAGGVVQSIKDKGISAFEDILRRSSGEQGD